MLWTLHLRGREAIHLCEQYHPDIVIMDIEMPTMSGIDALKVIKEQYPEIKSNYPHYI